MKSYTYKNISPQIHPDAYVFDDVVIVGDVVIEKNVSIWPGVTIRGDKEKIIIREGSNIQEHSVLHADPGFPLTIEPNATIGHGVVLHGCTVGAHTVVGIRAVLLNGVRVSENCLITAGSILSAGPRFPAGSLIAGTPAKVLMALSESDIQNLKDTAIEYQDLAQEYRAHLVPCIHDR
ncbi:carbonic anhydrase/acetyltransferase-like protein (isoleucine patch superfamily) [Limnobacter thiooxidans]|uniref:Gamma carbonic anhydrase family protein n=1 Tax=Limnobacter thiooxidans TaxID=131080 RepID=A0AA86J4J5_9BURK|nr:gamma carbonic anhydrase family protein [Limnobacter sp.]MCZ8014921.1 gamma carbonic anhydrase family protein [Limnobacter sp.]RZS40437.1 carbonic anhydrase/acetyltransferase-like protein (isoleucine patch superfamily) [Limnobacter thiooxidans]BET27129.1 gamma carbonic anhydrase family protein [Limnobacter thiooxidans]